MKKLTTWLIVGLLMITPVMATETSPHDRATQLKPGSKIEVATTGGTIQGRLGAVSQDTLTLLDVASSTTAPRLLRWTEITRLKSKEHGLGRRIAITTVIVLGVLVGVALVSRAAGCC